MKPAIIAFAILLACFSGCVQPEKKPISYPYHASPRRESQIGSGAPRVTPGMKPEQVKASLGEPDEIMDLFRRSDIEHNPVGYTYWYMIQREASPRSEPTDANQKLVRVCFDLDDNVTSVDYWGIDKPSDNKGMHVTPKSGRP